MSFKHIDFFTNLKGIDAGELNEGQLDNWIKKNKKLCQEYYNRYVEKTKLVELELARNQLQEKICYLIKNIGYEVADYPDKQVLIDLVKKENNIDLSQGIHLIFGETSGAVGETSGNEIYDVLLEELKTLIAEIISEELHVEQAITEAKEKKKGQKETKKETRPVKPKKDIYSLFEDERDFNEIILKLIIETHLYEKTETLGDCLKSNLGVNRITKVNLKQAEEIYNEMKDLLIKNCLI